MIEIIYSAETDVAALYRREQKTPEAVEAAVAEIIANVRENGDRAVLAYAEKFDRAVLSSLRVSAEEIAEAAAALPAAHKEALEKAHENITAFHLRQKRDGYIIADNPGEVMGQRILPIEKVGIYSPGGTAAYPSVVLMNLVPARIAGCEEVYLSTPTGSDGKIAPAILYAAALAGVTAVFKAGGAQAIAAFAYGTETIPRVDKILGPGNIYVATAKKQVFGLVGIDMIAGPSDILIIADGTCRPENAAADMLSQAEHDVLASAVLVTPDEVFARKTAEEIGRQLESLPRREIARQSVDSLCRIIITRDMDEAVSIANTVAPEHLEICVDEPFALLPAIKNAGSVFLGKNVPEAIGDFYAGPNNTLPTLGTARFSSPLGVDDFVKRSSFLYYSEEAVRRAEPYTSAFAEMEGLEGHGRSVTIRTERSGK